MHPGFLECCSKPAMTCQNERQCAVRDPAVSWHHGAGMCKRPSCSAQASLPLRLNGRHEWPQRIHSIMRNTSVHFLSHYAWGLNKISITTFQTFPNIVAPQIYIHTRAQLTVAQPTFFLTKFIGVTLYIKMYNTVIHCLYVASCVHHPNLSLHPSPYIWLHLLSSTFL